MKTPPELPDKPVHPYLDFWPVGFLSGVYQLKTGREKKKVALIAIGIFFFFTIFFASMGNLLVLFNCEEQYDNTPDLECNKNEDILAYRPAKEVYDRYEKGSQSPNVDDGLYFETQIVLGGYYFCLVMIFCSLYFYITTEISDEKPPEAIKYEKEMEQYQLENKIYEEELKEELKKDSPFYVGDGSAGSEMKNTCKRCNKIWYLDAEELKDLEGRLTKSVTIGKQMGGIGMISAMFNPMLAAQTATTMAANTGALKSLADELNEKSRCPECNSKNIERTLVETDDKVLDKKVKEVANKSEPSKMQELEKLSEMKKEGLIDDDEFKQMKKEILGK